jgi:cytochrome c-type biogenesis protein CcmH
MRGRWIALCLLLCWGGLTAHAGEATPLATNPAVEARMTALAEELRCLVCQNQSLADSHSELAGDLRREIREMISTGKTDAEIRDFMVARYGEFVLYRPPFEATTLLLWVGPFLLLLGAGFATYRFVKKADPDPEKNSD